MASVLTAEDVVRRIAAECAYVDERGGVGICLEPAAAIVRRYGEQFRRPGLQITAAIAETAAAVVREGCFRLRGRWPMHFTYIRREMRGAVWRRQ